MGVLACCVAYAGYVDAETIHFHLSGPISSASPSVNADAGTGNTLRKITHEHPGVLMVQGWPVNLPSHEPECGNVIEDALRKNSEVYVADEDCRTAMRKALYIQRTTPPPDPREVRYGISDVMPGAPEDPTDQGAPQTAETARPESPGERVGQFLKRIPN